MLYKLLEPYKIVLASASPRREYLLKMLNIRFEVQASHIVEKANGDTAQAEAINHALRKAQSVALLRPDADIIIGADTIVHLAGELLGKPDSPRQAADYLGRLSGNTHEVITGICLFYQGKAYSAFESSLVSFAHLSEVEIQAYIATGEPMDKAGAYGIQGHGSQFIQSIQGCYFNVMGFPIHRFYTLCKSMIQGTVR